MVERFLPILPPYPIGTRVSITSGRFAEHVAVVARLNHLDLTHPVIRVLDAPDGTRIDPVELDLRHDLADISCIATAPASVSV